MSTNIAPVVTIVIEFSEAPGYSPFPLAGRSGRVWTYCNFDPVRQRVCARMTLAEYREAREDLFMVPNRRFYYPLVDIEITEPELAIEAAPESNTVNSDPVANVVPPVVVDTAIPPEVEAVPESEDPVAETPSPETPAESPVETSAPAETKPAPKAKAAPKAPRKKK